MITGVQTYKFIAEAKTKNAPVRFLCSDQNVYHTKFIQAPAEYDCLVYEWLCNRLAQVAGIPVPEIALIHLAQNSFETASFYNPGNRMYMQPGCICFGTLDIGPHDMLNQQFRIHTQSQFAHYINPYDLVKTALFDMHTANQDRWEENFNLLIKRTSRKQFVAIDHYDTFGGLPRLAHFGATLPADINATVIRSDFFFSLLRFMDLQMALDAIAQYNYLCHAAAIQSTTDQVFEQIPATWQLSAGLKERILALLTNQQRLEDITEQVQNFIRINKQNRN